MVPHHVAIIMDGNRRWARERRFDVLKGHSQGSNTLKEIAEHAQKTGVEFLTVFAFSSENWRRPQREVNALIELMRRFLMQDLESLISDNVRLRIIGDLTPFDHDLRALFEDAVKQTSTNSGLQLTVAINYGGKQDLMQAMQKIATEKPHLKEISEEALKSALQTSELPEIDLLIRTGGEYRLSNFILWDSAYAELYFSEKYWPDFTGADLDEAITNFANRQRRFGGDVIEDVQSRKA